MQNLTNEINSAKRFFIPIRLGNTFWTYYFYTFKSRLFGVTLLSSCLIVLSHNKIALDVLFYFTIVSIFFIKFWDNGDHKERSTLLAQLFGSIWPCQDFRPIWPNFSSFWKKIFLERREIDQKNTNKTRKMGSINVPNIHYYYAAFSYISKE